MKSKSLFVQLLVIILVLLMAVPPISFAQEPGGPPPLKPEQVEQIVAPIALYPDSLLAQIVMASTFPLDIVQAARWSKENKNLQGDKLEAELTKKAWDASVKSLVSFPQVLAMMNENLEWTQKLGNAVVAQQNDVMDAVQKLRGKAYSAGYLKTTKEQQVVVERTPEVQIIKVVPVTQVVYVPTYNPTVVYGVWAYPAYPPPPVYPPGYVATASVVSFAAGVAVGAAVYGGMNWGHSHNSAVFINKNYHHNRGNINRGNVNIGNINTGNINRGNVNRGDGNWGGNRGDGNWGGNRGDGNWGGNRGDGNWGGNRGDGNRGGNRGDGNRGGNRGDGNRPSPKQSSAFGGSGNGGMKERSASSRGQSSRSSGGFQGGGKGGGGGGGGRGGGGGGRGGGGGGRGGGGGGRGGGRR